jgi:anti-sigma regulatory factor (Ser/Thr protein kinase)
MLKNLMEFHLNTTWQVVHQIHTRIIQFLKERQIQNSNADALLLGCTELIENAVKYGKAQPGCNDIEFIMQMDDEKMVNIIVRNGVASEEDVKIIKEILKQIKKAKDLQKLYHSRLLILLEKPKPKRTQLGLYRLAYEGQFDINYEYDNKVITITAIKILDKK